MEPRTFSVPLRILIALWIGVVLFSVMALCCTGFSLAFLLIAVSSDSGDSPRILKYSLLFLSLAAFFWGIAIWHIRAAWILPRSAVIVDDEGIRPARSDRTSQLVRWEEIGSFRERGFLQRIELLDVRDTSLMLIECRLGGLTDLLTLFLEKCPHRAALPPLPAAYRIPFRSLAIELLPTALAAMFFPAIWYSRIGLVWALVLALVFFLIGLWRWLRNIFEIVIHPDRVDARGLRAASTIYLEDASIRVIVTGTSDTHNLAVQVDSTEGEEPLRLSDLGVGPIELARLLLRLKREEASKFKNLSA